MALLGGDGSDRARGADGCGGTVRLARASRHDHPPVVLTRAAGASLATLLDENGPAQDDVGGDIMLIRSAEQVNAGRARPIEPDTHGVRHQEKLVIITPERCPHPRPDENAVARDL